MNIFQRIAGRLIRRGDSEKKAMAPVDERGWQKILEWNTGTWQTDDPSTVESQLTYYAVYSCVTLITNDFGKLRQRLVEKSGRIWRETTSPSFSPVLRNPNRYQNHIQFKEWWAMSKLTRGNAYALKQRDGRGVVTALYMLDPCRVTPLVSEDGAVFYELKQDHLSGIPEDRVIVPAREIIHDRMNCLFHPLVGISPLYAAGLAARHGLSIQQQSSTFFGNGARPSGVLVAPGAISNETAERLKTAWEEKFTGTNSGKVAVLGDGLKYEPMVMSSTDAQLIEQLKMTAEMVCAAFHVPAFKVGIGTMPTYQNGEMLNQIYYSDCLQSMIEQYELCMDEGLGIGEGVKTTEGRELGIELDLRGLLRMDTSTQVKTLGEAVKGSLMTVNEAREEMDFSAVAGGDSIWMQQQNYSLDALAERDRNDPFAKPPAPTPSAPPQPEAQEPDPTESEKSALRAGFYRKAA